MTNILLLSRDELQKRVVFFDNAENKKTSNITYSNFICFKVIEVQIKKICKLFRNVSEQTAFLFVVNSTYYKMFLYSGINPH